MFKLYMCIFNLQIQCYLTINTTKVTLSPTIQYIEHFSTRVNMSMKSEVKGLFFSIYLTSYIF